MAGKSKGFLHLISDEGEVGNVEPLSGEALDLFPDTYTPRWLRACRKLEGAGYGTSVLQSYITNSKEIARILGPDPAIEMADAVSAIAIKSGRRAASLFSEAAVIAALKLEKDAARFRSWTSLIQRLGGLAPESVQSVLEKMDVLLSRLNVAKLEAWILAGVRSAGSDAERRLAFFSFKDPDAERWLEHESGSIVLSDMNRELKAYINALWGIRVPVREQTGGSSGRSRRRASFGQGLIKVPTSFPGFRGEQAEDLFRAVMAHIGAHMMFSGRPFPVGELKPVQVALVSLVEDARVEQLAMREFPGLRRLWLPFHIAQATGSMTAPSLMARLARALIDPEFVDHNRWVTKSRDMFFDREGQWGDPRVSREIGNLIGNDLGQMRVQFNARTYVTQPPYRDDNFGLWDFGDQPTPESMQAEELFESINFEEQQDDDDSEPDREREDFEEDENEETEKASIDLVEQEGIPVARYPEFDYVTGSSRPDWTMVVEYAPKPGASHAVDDILERHPGVVNRIKSLVRTARISQPQKIRRQPEGEYLDLNAGIEAMISRRVGESPDPHVYARSERRQRDLSVLVLLDVSESTKDRVVASRESVLDLERQATALLAHAMAELGDPFAIAAFNSNRREDVRYYRIKDFNASYGNMAKSYLAGLESGYSTRLGAAMRHAAADLAKQTTHRRLLLVVTDGEPSDIDVTDRNYLVEDARHVIHELAMQGIDVFCVGLDSGGDNYLTRIFGRRNVVQVDQLERLPERLPMLYLRLTA